MHNNISEVKQATTQVPLLNVTYSFELHSLNLNRKTRLRNAPGLKVPMELNLLCKVASAPGSFGTAQCETFQFQQH